MLEQLLLQLRRADLVEARRGRYGGYRLGRPAREIAVAAVLEAVAGGAGFKAPLPSGLEPAVPMPQQGSEGQPVPEARAGGEAKQESEAQAKGQTQAEAVAEERVLAALERRLKRALERELRDLSLEDLHYDLRSWQESLSNDGGLLLG
jgi:DNA-binding IscR family transcriptional regulator